MVDLGIKTFIKIVFFVQDAAADTYIPLSTGLDNLGLKNDDLKDFGTFISALYQTAVGIAVIAAIIVIIWGGFIYMTTDAVGKKQEGKEKIKGALFGLLLALGSYLLFKLINPDILG